MEHGVPATASELEAVPILRKESGERKGSVKRRVVDSPALDKKERYTCWHGMLLKESQRA